MANSVNASSVRSGRRGPREAKSATTATTITSRPTKRSRRSDKSDTSRVRSYGDTSAQSSKVTTSRAPKSSGATRNKGTSRRSSSKARQSVTDTDMSKSLSVLRRHLAESTFNDGYGDCAKGTSNYSSIWGDTRAFDKMYTKQTGATSNWKSRTAGTDMETAISSLRNAVSGVGDWSELTGASRSSVIEGVRQYQSDYSTCRDLWRKGNKSQPRGDLSDLAEDSTAGKS
jgi:hypothetical protein